MVEETQKFAYYKINVNYSIIVRNFIGDKDGVLLSPRGRNIIAVDLKNLRDFRNANKQALLDAKIVAVEEPEENWETVNAITDEDIAELLRLRTKLKETLPTLTSLPILYKIQSAAVDNDSPKAVLSLIQARIAELEPEDEPFFRKDDMQGGRDE